MTGARNAREVECPEEPGCDVAVCRSCPGRLVFIETGNTDGWIATDAAVELEP